jgi:ketosteroid isomerase-like protein
MSALGGEFNRSTQHLLILRDGEVCDGREYTDMVYAEAED